jgi:proline iminopeptidase
MPVLVIAGRYDRALYPAYQREFARCAPQAELIMMERSGSFAHIEEPEALVGLLRQFLTGRRERSGASLAKMG